MSASSKAAVKIESGAYGTAIALNGGAEFNQVQFTSESITPQHKFESSIHLDGSAGKRSLYSTLNKYAGDLALELHYDGALSLLICALGMSNQNKSPVARGGSPAVYTHYIEPSRDLSTRAFDAFEEFALSNTARRRLTVGFEKSVSIHENASCMVNSFALSAKPDRTTLSFNLVAYAQAFDSGTNAASTNWAIPDATQLKFEEATLWLKARDNFTIAAGNKVIIMNHATPGDVTITLDEDTYTGGELAENWASKINASTMVGNYRVEYLEETRRFKVYTRDGELFSIEGANGSTTADWVLGFLTDTLTTESSYQGNVEAKPDAYTAFADGDRIGFNAFDLSYTNGLSAEDQDSLSGNKIVEPERNELRTISGSIEMPRYTNDTFVTAANKNTTYVARLRFTGALISGANYEQFEINLPSIKFSSNDVSIGGAEILKQKLSFQASFADYLDFVNFFPTEYFVHQDFYTASPANIECMARFVDGLYIGYGNGTTLGKFTPTGGFTVASSGLGGIPNEMVQYGNNLYIGKPAGVVSVWDGSTVSLSCDVGAGAVRSLAVFDQILYVLEQSTGRVNAFDGTTWSLACDTTLTDATQLIAFDGYLWVFGSDGTNIDVHRYDGSSWTTAANDAHVSSNGEGQLCIHMGRLFMGVDDKVYEWDGSAFTERADIGVGISIILLISWKGELLCIDTNQDFRLINLAAGNSAILLQMTDTVAKQYATLDGHLMLPDWGGSLSVCKNVQEMYIKIQNKTSANPL